MHSNQPRVYQPSLRHLYAAVLSMALTIITASSARAWDYTLTDGNSSVTVLADSTRGMSDWTVDGVPQLWEQSFFYRKGNSGGEKPVSYLNLCSAELTSANSLTTLYQSAGHFSIEIKYTLLGGVAGSGSSTIGEQIKITNLSGQQLNFHFFQFVDFDLGGSHGNDTLQLSQNLAGLYDFAFQHKGTSFFSDEVVSPGAQHAEAGLSPTIYNKLIDNSPTTLNGNVGPVTGDATWAFQWDAAIPVGGSFNIDLTKNVFVTAIPEPTAMALIPAALVLLACARRRLNGRQ